MCRKIYEGNSYLVLLTISCNINLVITFWHQCFYSPYINVLTMMSVAVLLNLGTKSRLQQRPLPPNIWYKRLVSNDRCEGACSGPSQDRVRRQGRAEWWIPGEWSDLALLFCCWTPGCVMREPQRLNKNDIFMWWWEKITKDTTDLYFKSLIYLWGSLALSICVWSVYLCSPTCV